MATTTTTTPARSSRLPRGIDLVRLALRVDAALTGINGLAFLVLAGPLSDALGLSEPLLLGVGAFFVLYASALAVVAARPAIPLALVRLIAAGNALWVLLSAVVLIAGVLDPTTAGTVYLVAQALLVADFALLQLFAARRAGSQI